MIQTEHSAITAARGECERCSGSHQRRVPADHADSGVPPASSQRPAHAHEGRKLARLIVLAVDHRRRSQPRRWSYPQPVRDALAALTKPRATERLARHRPGIPAPVRRRPTASSHWANGQCRGWASRSTTVVPQTEPIRLELLGTTEYDSDNQTRIRPLFKGRVDRVYAKVGQLIKKGEPLIEFYSTDLGRGQKRLRDRANPVGLLQ